MLVVNPSGSGMGDHSPGSGVFGGSTDFSCLAILQRVHPPFIANCYVRGYVGPRELQRAGTGDYEPLRAIALLGGLL